MIREALRLHELNEYYFSQKMQQLDKLSSVVKVINLGIGNPDLQPHPQVIQAFVAAAHTGNNGYQSYRGLAELRSAMADFYRTQFCVALDPDAEILPLMGSKEGIMHVTMAFANPGDVVLVPNPAYPTYEAVAKLAGARVVHYDLDPSNSWLPNWQQLEQLALQGPKIMWVNYPNMPTGQSATPDVWMRFIEFATRHGILLVNDNPYSLILNPTPISVLSFKGAQHCAIEFNSLSKSFNIAGWRVGMAVGNARFINSILKVKSNVDSGMNYAIQKAAACALQASPQWFVELNAIYHERRKLVWKIVEQLGLQCDPTAVGLFVWAKLPKDANDVLWVEQLLEQHAVFVAPGQIFGKGGVGYVRFSLCASVDDLQEVLKRVQP